MKSTWFLILTLTVGGFAMAADEVNARTLNSESRDVETLVLGRNRSSVSNDFPVIGLRREIFRYREDDKEREHRVPSDAPVIGMRPCPPRPINPPRQPLNPIPAPDNPYSDRAHKGPIFYKPVLSAKPLEQAPILPTQFHTIERGSAPTPSVPPPSATRYSEPINLAGVITGRR